MDEEENTLEGSTALPHRPLNSEEDLHETLQERFDRLHHFWTTQVYPLQNHTFVPYLGLGFALFLLLYLPWHTFRAILQEEDRPDEVAFTSAAVFVLITLILSTSLIYSHLSNWYMPDVQK